MTGGRLLAPSILVRGLALAAFAIGTAACGGTASGAGHPATTTTRPPATTTSAPPPTTPPATTTTTASTTTTTTTATTLPPAPATTVPGFDSSVSPVTAADLGETWHSGCPVGPDGLRTVQLSYWGFDGRPHTGRIVVSAAAVAAVVKVFGTLYSARFPLAEMVPESAYGGDDDAAAAADDTSGFNCRLAVASGPPQWSEHAYGLAIDVNDVQNPYVDGSTVIPPTGAAYEDRADVRPGMAVWGGVLVDAFASVGWQWGGRWTATPDYQHFSANGG